MSSKYALNKKAAPAGVVRAVRSESAEKRAPLFARMIKVANPTINFRDETSARFRRAPLIDNTDFSIALRFLKCGQDGESLTSVEFASYTTR